MERKINYFIYLFLFILEITTGGCRSEKEREGGRRENKRQEREHADCRRREEDSRREMQAVERKKEKMVQTGEGGRREKRE
jgi:hypothetical protein